MRAATARPTRCGGPGPGVRICGNDVPGSGPAHGRQTHRLRVLDLDLPCAHCVTVAANRWYPGAAACCDRVGCAIADGLFVALCSDVDYVRRRVASQASLRRHLLS
jgi:hypothetical protein